MERLWNLMIVICIEKFGSDVIACWSLGYWMVWRRSYIQVYCIFKQLHRSGMIFICVSTNRIFHDSTSKFILFDRGVLIFLLITLKCQSLWEELSSLQIASRSFEDLLNERETNKVIYFLMGLNESYDTVRNQILMKKSLPSLSEVYNLLDNEDTQKSARAISQIGSDVSACQISQQTSQIKPGQSYSGSQYQKKDTRPVCTFCGKSGHVMDRCYKKHGYPVGFQSKQKFNKASPNITANVSLIQLRISVNLQNRMFLPLVMIYPLIRFNNLSLSLAPSFSQRHLPNQRFTLSQCLPSLFLLQSLAQHLVLFIPLSLVLLPVLIGHIFILLIAKFLLSMLGW